MSETTHGRLSESDTPTVFVVDDDSGIRRGMEFLLQANGLKARCYESAEAFLEAFEGCERGCLLLDVRMPGMDGLALLEELSRRDRQIPTIIVTAYGNIPMAVRAMRAGAFDIVEKPPKGKDLLERVYRAIARDNDRASRASQTAEVRQRLQSLTPRERQVLDGIIEGMLNKQIAAELGIALKTVENHRAHLMEKMGASGVAELVRMVVTTDEGPGA